MKKVVQIILTLSLFSSCKSENKQALLTVETTAITDSTTTSADIGKYPAWITEFQRLRQALYQKDTDQIKTFFDFPLTEEQTGGLIEAINFSSEKEINPRPVFNTKHDVMKYFSSIFRSDFIKGILPIKSDSLLRNGYSNSERWKLPKDEAHYSVSVSYDESDKSVSLMLNAEYGITEDGNEDNKTESAVDYIFKLNKNNKLKFQRAVMAG